MSFVKATTQRPQEELPILLIQEMFLPACRESDGRGEAGEDHAELAWAHSELSVGFSSRVVENEL